MLLCCTHTYESAAVMIPSYVFLLSYHEYQNKSSIRFISVQVRPLISLASHCLSCNINHTIKCRSRLELGATKSGFVDSLLFWKTRHFCPLYKVYIKYVYIWQVSMQQSKYLLNMGLIILFACVISINRSQRNLRTELTFQIILDYLVWLFGLAPVDKTVLLSHFFYGP